MDVTQHNPSFTEHRSQYGMAPLDKSWASLEFKSLDYLFDGKGSVNAQRIEATIGGKHFVLEDAAVRVTSVQIGFNLSYFWYVAESENYYITAPDNWPPIPPRTDKPR